MKLGVLVSLTGREALDRKFADLKKYGFESCQLCSWDPSMWTDENAAAVAEISEKHGITISGFWCGWEGPSDWNFYEGQLTLGLVPVDYRYARVKNLCDGADFAHRLGITDVVTHMGFIPENPYDPNYPGFCRSVRIVAEHLKRNGQYLLFETGQETPVTMLRCFETVGCDNLAVNLDTANLILYGKANPVDALEVFGKYVRNLHAKDGCWPVNGHDLGVETAIGEGRVDFPAVFRKLHELGYDSWVTIEREIDGDRQLTDILNARDYLNGIVESVYGRKAD